MRNLILFFIRYYAFFIFLLMEAFGFYITYKQKHFQQVYFIHSANRISGSILNRFQKSIDYFQLNAENNKLLMENAKLRSMLPGSHRIDSSKVIQAADSLGQIIYTYIPARVINNSTSNFNNYITIDQGKKQGIEPGMGLMGPQGIVGVINHVSDHFATAISVLHHKFNAKAKIKRNNITGILAWNKIDRLHAQLQDIGRFNDVLPGDTILTSSYSTIFPDDILIGVVDSVYIPLGSNYFDISVLLSTSFSSLDHVYVVNYIFKREQQLLESINANE